MSSNIAVLYIKKKEKVWSKYSWYKRLIGFDGQLGYETRILDMVVFFKEAETAYPSGPLF